MSSPVNEKLCFLLNLMAGSAFKVLDNKDLGKKG